MENNQNTTFPKEYDLGPETGIDKRKPDFGVTGEQKKDNYEIGPETKVEEQKLKIHEGTSMTESEADNQKYGVGKPKRVILRGKLTYD